MNDDITKWPFRVRLILPGERLAHGETVRDFPLLVVLRKQNLRVAEKQGHVAYADGRDFRFVAADGATPLDFEIETYDPETGALSAWVRLPVFTGGIDLPFYLLYGRQEAVPPRNAHRVWDRHYQTVLHLNAKPGPACDSTAFRRDAVAQPPVPGMRNITPATNSNGNNDQALCLRSAGDLSLAQNFTIEAWFNSTAPAERMQTLVACWKVRDAAPELHAYDAGFTSDMETGGFLGAICDGRYVYFVPQHDRIRQHGKVLRYDTHGGFSQPESWQAYDAGTTADMDTRGYYGAVFDGTYIYFVPRADDAGCHNRVLRYDTRLPFQSEQSWDAFDVGHDFACQSGGFDGRYIYFASGKDRHGKHRGAILRYDTQAPFKNADAWKVFDAAHAFGDGLLDFSGMIFDGRYMYLTPRRFNIALRYDVTAPFDQPESWEIFDAGPLGMRQCVGAVFDGAYVYFIPCDHYMVLRFDTTRAFSSSDAWRAYDVRRTGNLTAWGYAGGFFDGRFVRLVPFFGKNRSQQTVFHGQMLQFDTSGDFADGSSWRMVDISAVDDLQTVGYNAGAFDGRYFYYAPWHDGKVFMAEKRIEGHALVIRQDTADADSVFSLKCSDFGHNGGLSGTLIGPAFALNTDSGYFCARQFKTLPPGRHYLAGVYNDNTLRLFVDGKPAAEQPVRGTPCKINTLPVTLGTMADGEMRLTGTLAEVRISSSARSAGWIRLSFANRQAPESFCTAEPEETD